MADAGQICSDQFGRVVFTGSLAGVGKCGRVGEVGRQQRRQIRLDPVHYLRNAELLCNGCITADDFVKFDTSGVNALRQRDVGDADQHIRDFFRVVDAFSGRGNNHNAAFRVGNDDVCHFFYLNIVGQRRAAEFDDFHERSPFLHCNDEHAGVYL